MPTVKQAIKKGSGIRKGGLSAFKDKLGLTPSVDNMAMSNSNKPQKFIPISKAFTECLHIPGIPVATTNIIIGHSDTGKTLIIDHLITNAQKMGYIPVIYDTENNLSWKLLETLGFKCEPVYGEIEVEVVDNETGEITTKKEKQIIGYDGDFLYFNNRILAEMYGNYDYSANKEVQKKRKEAVIEDIARSINTLLDAQDNGEIEAGFVFIWDSIGSITSFKSYTSKTGNNMFDAGAVSQAFNNILNSRIPGSRKMSSKYENTFVGVNKIWLDSMSCPTGVPIMQTKNGKSIFYACRLCIQAGKIITSGSKKLTAVSKGATYRYGTVSTLSVKKNHLEEPWNITYEGEIICTPHGIISKNELAEYQKTHISEMLGELNKSLSERGQKATENDVEFIEEDIDIQ